MSMSGIEVVDEVKELFQRIKSIDHKKTAKSEKYVFFKIENKKRIVVDTEVTAPCEKTDTKEADRAVFEGMKDKLGKDPRYILYDFGFTTDDGRIQNKLAFIFWCDDNTASVGDRMIYASSKDTVKKVFDGIAADFQANDKSDLDYNEFAEKVVKK